MAIQTFNFQPGTAILSPAQYPEKARTDIGIFGPNLSITRGTALGTKTADGKLYAFASGASDGTQYFKALAAYSFVTDANGTAYLKYGSTVSATPDYYTTGQTGLPVFITGIFDPQDLQTAATPTAQVLTFTPTNPTTGDVYTLTYTGPDLSTTAVSFTIGATQTAAAASAGLIAAWNGNATLAAIATATGTSTVILTSVTAGNADSVAASVVGTGTCPKVTTTASAGRAIADIQTGAPGARVLPNGFWDIP